MPATFDTLAALLVSDNKPFPTEGALDSALTDLEDRGLVGWDKRANRFDIHPIVRGVAWSELGKDVRQDIYETLREYC